MPQRPALPHFPSEGGASSPERQTRTGEGQLCTVLRHRHGPRWQPGPRISVWPLVGTWAMDIDRDPFCCRTTEPDMGLDLTMASSGSTGYSHQGTHVQLFLTTLESPVPALFIAYKPFPFYRSTTELAHCSEAF